MSMQEVRVQLGSLSGKEPMTAKRADSDVLYTVENEYRTIFVIMVEEGAACAGDQLTSV